MFNFLRRAAASAGPLSAVHRRKTLVRPRVPSPPRGHMALARQHRGLRDLDAALASGDAAFLDAAHALAASSIRANTITGRLLRSIEGASADASKDAAPPGSEGVSDAAVQRRIQQALLRAREGRFEEALADLDRVVGDSPGDPDPRIAASALCYLQGAHRPAGDLFAGLPPDAVIWPWTYEIATVLAMPGSSPQPARRTFDGNVMCRATRLAESTLFASLGKGEWSMASKVMLSLSFRLLRIFVSQYRLVPCNPVDRSAPGPGAGARGRPIPGNTMLVECSQAILASALQARPLCGARLQEVRSVAQRALALAEAEGDIPAAVDVNLVLAFLATRDGQFDEALRRYKAAAQKDPADSRPYELADWLCCLVGLAKEQNAWRRSKKKLGGGTKPHDGLPVLRDQLLVAAALGHGGLTASDAHRAHISPAAWREVDVWLAAAALHLGLNRLTIRMLRAALRRLIQQWQP